MARIRTIKPEFFTSEDIVSLTPLARVFYIALWCEADREGRLDWRPGTLKMRYLPGDDCQIRDLEHELTNAGLIVIYEIDGKEYAEIPTFKTHQVINNRESDSTRPPRVNHASARVQAEGKERKEGKGREGASSPDGDQPQKPSSKGSRLPADWQPSPELLAWAKSERPDLTIASTIENFRDYWIGKAGKDATKVNWDATFRTWVRNERSAHGYAQTPKAQSPRPML